ncbi:reverse transcriptase-rnase h-integrase [Moniliophthora roreri MCA 2997]|nr:reverse transcriptase-rnase h-integrase [Moniliophthora roreri MCA 2997]
MELKNKIEEALSTDNFKNMAIKSLLEKGVPPIKSTLKDWEVKDNLLFFKDRVHIPNNPDLQQTLVKSIHEALPHGHPGQWNTIDQIKHDYWWPEMAKYIQQFVDRCAACQQMKINTHSTRTPIQPIGGHKDVLPFQICTMDLITDLPKVDNNDSILIVVDHATTKRVTLIPCNKKLDAKGAVELLLANIYK